MSSKKSVRFGILSTAGIGIKEYFALAKCKKSEVVALSSRSKEKLEKHAKLLQAPGDVKLYNSYDELLSDVNIDCVYIPLPSGIKKDWIVKALKSGKHVIAEKPFASEKESTELTKLAAEKKLMLLDNTMFLHHKRTLLVKEKYFDKKIIRAHSVFNFLNKDRKNIRFNPVLEPLGALGDIGWYCLHGLLWGFNYELPVSVSARGVFSEEGSNLACSGTLTFTNNREATFSCSFLECTHQDLILYYEDRFVTVQDFVIPVHCDLAAFVNIGRKECDKIPYEEKTSFFVTDNCMETKVIEVEECVQVDNLVDTFCECVISKKPNLKWMENSTKVCKIMDALFESMKSKKEVVLKI